MNDAERKTAQASSCRAVLRFFVSVGCACTSRAKRSSWWIVASAYLALAIWATWPLAGWTEPDPKSPLARRAFNFTTALPQGTESVATVPLFNLWTIWWNADRARHGFHGYWDAPIFYPA